MHLTTATLTDMNNNNIVNRSVSVCYKCSKCDKLFESDSLLRTHQEISCFSAKNEAISAGKKKRSFICNECGIEVKSQSELNKHFSLKHDEQKVYMCSHCDTTFEELSSRNRHEKEVHVQQQFCQKPFRCYICSFEFTRASNLRTHLLKVHPNDVGKLVHINKAEDNKLKFEFDLGDYCWLNEFLNIKDRIDFSRTVFTKT